MLSGGAEGPVESGTQPESLIDPRLAFPAIPGQTREEILRELSRRVAAQGVVPDAGELADRLLDRERLGCTGLGGGIAIPHCKLSDIDRVAIAVASTAQPVDFGAADGKPVSLIFLVASPATGAAAHLQALARVSRLLRAPGVADGLRRASTRESLLDVIREAEAGLPVAQ
jgi:PTS system nitrogen regulatory IIA component